MAPCKKSPRHLVAVPRRPSKLLPLPTAHPSSLSVSSLLTQTRPSGTHRAPFSPSTHKFRSLKLLKPVKWSGKTRSQGRRLYQYNYPGFCSRQRSSSSSLLPPVNRSQMSSDLYKTLEVWVTLSPERVGSSSENWYQTVKYTPDPPLPSEKWRLG